MKVIRFGPMSLVISLVMLASGLVGILWFAGPSTEDSFAADGVRVESPVVPASHQVYLTALQKSRDLAYKNQTADACIRDLSRTLGMKIQFHESTLKHIHKKGTVNLATTEPVSHQTAIRLVMQSFSLYEYGIVFEDNQITLVVNDGYHGPSLRTYDLMSRSDFSTALRRREIESTLNEVHPDSWSTADKTWIQPGESVFEIDVYQSQEVHNEIRRRLYDQHTVIMIDEDVQNLSIFGFIEQEKTGKKIDKEAVVQRLRKKYAFKKPTKASRNTRKPSPYIRSCVVIHFGCCTKQRLRLLLVDRALACRECPHLVPATCRALRPSTFRSHPMR